MGEDDRKLILQRRQRMLAVALASAGVGASLNACDPYGSSCRTVRRYTPHVLAESVGCKPLPCLSVALVVADAGPPDARPGPCLSVPLPRVNDAGDAGDSADAADASSAKPKR